MASRKRYTNGLIRDKESARYVKIAFVNDKEVPFSLTRPQIWDKLIKDDKAIFIFDMLTTECYVYSIDYYEAHPEIKDKQASVYI